MTATLNGANCQTLSLTIPARGAWVAECSTDGPPPALGEAATLVVLGETYLGTVVHRGEYAGQGGARIVGGKARWGNVLPARHYHSDAGVQRRTVVADLAREAGEELAEQASGVMGTDWTRATGEASQGLDAALSGGPWYVGADGRTWLSERPPGAMAGTVLDWDPVSALVVLGLSDSLAGIAPGLAISDERLPAPLTAREIRVELSGCSARAVAWCPEEAQGRGRLATALAEIVGHAEPRRLWGKWRYRVFRTSGDRVEAQAVKRAAGLPDIVPVEQWPGVSGVFADLSMGSEVLVEFIEGDPAQPIVTAYAPKGSPGWVPVSLSLCDGTSPVARVGDSVIVMLGAGVSFTGTISGAPAVGTLTSLTPLAAVIAGGSPRVKA